MVFKFNKNFVSFLLIPMLLPCFSIAAEKDPIETTVNTSNKQESSNNPTAAGSIETTVNTSNKQESSNNPTAAGSIETTVNTSNKQESSNNPTAAGSIETTANTSNKQESSNNPTAAGSIETTANTSNKQESSNNPTAAGSIETTANTSNKQESSNNPTAAGSIETTANTSNKQESSNNPTATNNFLDSTRRTSERRRAPIVSSSQISKAIDQDYSFLYDPNFSTEIISDMSINPDNYVVMYLETGDTVLIKLRKDIAPNTVVRFKQLVKENFYEDMEIFRAIPDYLAQTGDPSGSGYGGKGVFYFAEVSPDEKFKRGTVAMSNNGNLQSDDTQFFITFNSFDWLDGKYTIFGEIVLGMGKLENVNKTFSNDGFVSDPSIITKMELLSDRPADRIDDLSKIIPADKQKQAIKKQEKNIKKETARQNFLLEDDKRQEQIKTTQSGLSVEIQQEKTDVTSNENDSVDEQTSSTSNPYLRFRGR